MKNECPFSKALRHLKMFAGLPVPVTAKWINGKPDFRQIDEEELVRDIRYKLCAVCGRKLGLTCYWVGGPLCQQNHYFHDGPMHEVCARESMRLCPFLNGTRKHYRGDIPTQKLHNTDGRPARMFLMRGLTSAWEVRRLGKEEAAQYAGDHLTDVCEF